MKKYFIKIIIVLLFLLVLIWSPTFQDIKVIGTETYTVAEGDTLWEIAERQTDNTVDVRDYIRLIRSYNDNLSSELKVGQTIVLPILNSVAAYEFNLSEDYSALMAEAIVNNNYDAAKYYEDLRCQKKTYLGIQDDVTYDNLLLLAKIIQVEAGSDWLTEEHRRLVASVVVNRVNSPEFPNTIHDVIYQRGQYASVRTNYFQTVRPSRASTMSALHILANGSIAPPDVVFQANFRQGGGVYKAIHDNKLRTTYFCYSNNRKLYI